MKEWTSEIEIDVPIEEVWSLIDGSLEDMQKIMPQVIEHTPVKITEEKVGSIYRQKYQEGKRVEAYDVETIEYLNQSDQKVLKIAFTLANMFKITTYYKLVRINDEKTRLTYTATNQPLKWFTKLFLVFASDKVVVKFVERVKEVAEEEYRSTKV